MPKHLTGRGYFLTWLGLIGLTTLTLILSFARLGPLEAPVALGIAFTKTVLVAFFFMHLIEEGPSARLAALAGLIYLTVLVLLTDVDVATRTGAEQIAHARASAHADADTAANAADGKPFNPVRVLGPREAHHVAESNNP